jgi:SAM-dependent methyltransferase
MDFWGIADAMNKSFSPGFVREPLRIVDSIPVFSHEDAYVDNYRRIAADHLAVATTAMENPYIENALWAQLDQSTRELMTNRLSEGAAVLDVGVGLGRILGPLAQYRRFGIDISLDYLVRARAQGIEVAFARAEDMPYPDGVFDAVVCCDVLEHVLEFDHVVRQILRVLRPGGWLFVRVPYREDLKGYLQKDLPYEFIHLRNFDEHSIRLYFEKIHRCELIQTTFVAPYWQGETRLRYRMVPADAPVRGLVDGASLLGAGLDAEGAALLESMLRVSEEQLVAWINRIKVDAPALFEAIRPHLIHAIEMNAVIGKPS